MDTHKWRKHIVKIPGILIIVALIAGCDRKSSLLKKITSSGDSSLIAKTGNYPSKSLGLIAKWGNGGLDSLGDINGDSYTDIIVGSGGHPGSFAAYSGKNGERLWQVKAFSSNTPEAKRHGEKGFTLKTFMVIDDVNGDKIQDIYAENAWHHKEFFIFSGKDGKRIVRKKIVSAIRPMFTRDIDGDGTIDFVFNSGRKLGIRVVSGKTYTEILKKENLIPLKEKTRQSWEKPEFADINGDEKTDSLALIQKADGNTYIAFMSGKDFSLLKRIKINPIYVKNNPRIFSPGDINGDYVADIGITSRYGGGKNERNSFLLVLSGKDGSLIWKTEGTSLPGGQSGFSVNAKTGKKTEHHKDVGFGESVIAIPDVNSDGIRDIATVLPVLKNKKHTMGLIIFSGKNGEILSTLLPDTSHAKLYKGTQLCYIESIDGKGTPGIVVSGIISKKKYAAVFFPLPKTK